MDTQLSIATKIVLGNTFTMYFKAHSYHWNIEGKNFQQMHNFFGDLYDELHDAVDTTAEQVRALDVYAPISIDELYKYKSINEDTTKPGYCAVMLGNLLSANAEVISSLNQLFKMATAEGNQGLADFAAGRLDVHAKHGWMIRSFMKGE